MKIFLATIIIITISLVTILMYALCKIASIADDEMEQYWQHKEEEDKITGEK